MVIRHYPQTISQIKISGGVGFDLYRILPKIDKTAFLEKYQKKTFCKIIGIGCWDFGFIYREDMRYGFAGKLVDDPTFSYFDQERRVFNEIILNIIKKNPDILFLIKEHPGCLLGYKGSAIEGCDKFHNVLILKNQEPIINCISVSDFWVTYESTTALEAWLLMKQTCLINPQGGNFKRDKVALGSPIYTNFDQIQDAIRWFGKTGELIGFKEREAIRREIICETIQWDDGLNHVRVGNDLISFLSTRKKVKRKYGFSFIGVYSLLRWYLCEFPILRNIFKYYKNKKDRFRKKDIQLSSEYLQRYQLKFYQNKDLSNIHCI